MTRDIKFQKQNHEKIFSGIVVFSGKNINMLSIEKAKEILNDENISDEEILEIRDNLYGLAEIAIESYVKEKKDTKA